MNEIEKAIAYFEVTSSESDNIMKSCAEYLKPILLNQKTHFVTAMEALCEKQENDKLKAEGRLVVLPDTRLLLVWGDQNRDTVLCPCCESDLMGGYSLGHNGFDYPMYQCPYCGQPIDGTKSVTREKALEE